MAAPPQYQGSRLRYRGSISQGPELRADDPLGV